MISPGVDPGTPSVDQHRLPVDRLAATSLEELTSEGALMTRTDRKYVVATHALPSLMTAFQALDPNLKVLEIDGLRRQRYDSTYLDTPELEAYWRAARSRRHRFKIRTRHYLDTDAAFTEVKTRGPRGTTVMARTGRAVPLDGATPSLTSADDGFVETELHRAGLSHVDVSTLVPTLRTTYVRSTLWLPSSSSRATIDLDLTWSLPWSGDIARVPGLAVIETKTTGARTGVDRALWAQGHRPTRISKYATGLALLLPDLPAHRWHRVRTQQLQSHVTYHHTEESA
ncbi:polyphosphate polymerase domain-containing protein [Nocardioides sp.]|uniref:polyphosphate polymerase domain-containing protein n=1 Tax=Nocardioides sp. TaxID=35761 RepID=UPI002B279C4B|nr:polyphosphate polymerase domain-containing protein [Nocardioides sp.]